MLEFEKEFDTCKRTAIVSASRMIAEHCKGKTGSAFAKCRDEQTEAARDVRWDCEVKVRRKYRSYLSGRYSDMGEKVHRFIALADKKHLEKHKNQTLRDIAMEYGVIEEMSKEF